jgi:putative ABC transport system permease protein
VSEPMWRRVRRLVRPRTAQDVDDELALHLELRTQDYLARGMSEAEARDAARARLGDVAAARAACIAITSGREHRVLRSQLWDAFVQDIRFGLRTLGRQKGWTIAAVFTLALGIGATTSVFSTVSSLLLHPLPYPDAGRLAIAFQRPSTGNSTGVSIQITPSAAEFRAWKAGTRAFDELQGWTSSEVTLQPRGGSAERRQAAAILPGFLRFAGQHVLLGRDFQADDARAKVMALGEGLWRSRFAADPGVIGRTVVLDGDVFTVIGVMPEALRVPGLRPQQTDVWRPLDPNDEDQGLSVIGRLRPGVSYAAAEADLDSAEARGGAPGRANAFRTVVVPPRAMVHFQDTLALLSAAVALVLIIACANVAHLLLARGAARPREMAVRAALGAGAGRLRRQLMTESLVLALAGCGLGILFGQLGLKAILALRPEGLAQLDAAHLDTTTLGATVVLALVSGVLFGVVGASQSTRLAAPDGLRAGSRGASAGRPHHRLRSLLVVTEMALSTALLVGAALLVRSIAHLQMIDPGFRAEGLYAIDPRLPSAGYPDAAARSRFFEALDTRLRAIPGVEAVTIAAGAPPSRSFMIGALQIDGEPAPPAGTTSFVDFNGVTPDFFQVMGIGFVQGRTFTDTAAAANQVIVNQGMARRRWPGQSALGKRLRIVFRGNGDWKTVVGVVNDAATGGLAMEAGTPMLYLPATGTNSPAAIVRSSRPEAVLPAIRGIAAQIDPRLPPLDIVNVGEAMQRSIAGRRFTMTLISAFTVLAVLLAAVGLYGLVSYAVTQRTREIGIRIALGASRGRIARTVLLQGLSLGVAGMLVGLVAARFGVRLLQDLLSGVTTTDAGSYAAAGTILLVTVLLACLVPMARAMAVPPQTAMQSE